MKENNDILLASANKANRNTPLAHLATQALSIGSSVSKLWYYNYQLGMAKAMGPGYLPASQIRKMKQDRLMHTVSIALTCLGLIAAGICSLEER